MAKRKTKEVVAPVAPVAPVDVASQVDWEEVDRLVVEKYEIAVKVKKSRKEAGALKRDSQVRTFGEPIVDLPDGKSVYLREHLRQEFPGLDLGTVNPEGIRTRFHRDKNKVLLVDVGGEWSTMLGGLLYDDRRPLVAAHVKSTTLKLRKS